MTVYSSEVQLPPSSVIIPTDVILVDIETRKVETPADCDVVLSTGYRMRRRWQTFAIGMLRDVSEGDGVWIIEVMDSNDEEELLRHFEQIAEGKRIVYAATRSFDEMVLKGRFINARDRFLAEPGPWPHVSGALAFQNIHKSMQQFERADDVASKDVPDAWERGEEDVVITHCIRDIAELAMSYGCGVEAFEFLRRILVTPDPHMAAPWEI